jgi:hypothetical protein
MDLPMHETGETRNCVKILTNVYLYESVHGCCLMPRGQYLAISQLEQVLFLWDVDDDCFVQDLAQLWVGFP